MPSISTTCWAKNILPPLPHIHSPKISSIVYNIFDLSKTFWLGVPTWCTKLLKPYTMSSRYKFPFGVQLFSYLSPSQWDFRRCTTLLCTQWQYLCKMWNEKKGYEFNRIKLINTSVSELLEGLANLIKMQLTIVRVVYNYLQKFSLCFPRLCSIFQIFRLLLESFKPIFQRFWLANLFDSFSKSFSRYFVPFFTYFVPFFTNSVPFFSYFIPFSRYSF